MSDISATESNTKVGLMEDLSRSSREVSPVRTSMDDIPAQSAIYMSVYRRSPTITVPSGSTPISRAAISSINAFGFPMTIG